MRKGIYVQGSTANAARELIVKAQGKLTARQIADRTGCPVTHVYRLAADLDIEIKRVRYQRKRYA